MPFFDFMNKVEFYVRTGTFPADSTKSSRKVTRAASKKFTYKDGCLWRSYRGRLLRVVRSDEEVREILTRYHDNNNHIGRVRTIKDIMMMHYWVGVTAAVTAWIKACAVCKTRSSTEPHDLPVQFCLAYKCDATSYIYPELSFFRFPKERAQRQKWLEVAQRDEASLRSSSRLCSRHFDPSCFSVTEEGQLTLLPDAAPTIIPVTVRDDEDLVPSDDDSLDHVSAPAAETTEHSETPGQMQEHLYCLPAPDPNSRAVEPVRRRTVIEPSFTVYNQIARYLSHRILPMQSKKVRGALKRMAKRFDLIDGVLMYTRVSPPLRVPRSREEVNSILQQFHDNKGHHGQGICQQRIAKHFFWGTMTRDLARWISSCSTCLNRTKRKWLRCSIYSCTNCCGPVERGLGLTFHKFPLHDAAMLAQWLKAVGRPNWHPRLRSSICSAHFTERCFDRSGDKVTLRADAVPTLMTPNDSATQPRGLTQAAFTEEAYFAKYDAVELYLRRRIYPPGLSYVEKNTFRRFCKKFVIKDGELHMVKGDRVRLVLRSRQQVDVALTDYHNELNHLDVSKCLRLLSERYFWKTMRPDVVQWINRCSQCSRKNRPKPQNQTEPRESESQLQVLRSSQIQDLDSGKDDDDDDFSDDDEEDDADVGGGSDGDEERQQQPATTTDDRLNNPAPPLCPHPAGPIHPPPRVPIILYLRAPTTFQPRTPNAPFVARLMSVPGLTPPQSQVQEETNSLEVWPGNQIEVEPQLEEQIQHQRQTETSRPLTEPHPPPGLTAKAQLPQAASKDIQPPSPNGELKTQSQISTQPRSPHRVQHLLKRKRELVVGSSGKRSYSCGLEPVMAPSTKPWPVFTINRSTPLQTAQPPAEVDSPAPVQRPRRLQARAIIQHCSQAKVKLRPALDGAAAQWAEIQDGMVVYVCFFHGATEDVTYEMANRLMTTKHFRKDTRHMVSLLDLPGSVLFIPQDSLVGEPVPRRRVQYRGGCELWWGAQLFSNLVSTCRDLMSKSAKCTKAGMKVEHGVYGQKQEIVLNSLEPLTLLLEF
ncbi:uncharacterized protein LOC113131072 [Mastacembelus armatus]|uniref:THAP domain-containing protein 1 n=1 Tax=Mastacembelus armatus TaxID=205130 RepID=A0A3Q3KSR3_9TELE|nr:uncharacterized protein LOC113131072 [Mastacembelus armatus]